MLTVAGSKLLKGNSFSSVTIFVSARLVEVLFLVGLLYLGLTFCPPVTN